MAAVASFELYAVDLPFRKPFRHAAAERNESSSLFLKCTTDTGISGFGETLPRDYVTGESRESAFAMLRDAILPRLVGQNFDSLDEVEAFLQRCDGQTPGWISADTPSMPPGAPSTLRCWTLLAGHSIRRHHAVSGRRCR